MKTFAGICLTVVLIGAGIWAFLHFHGVSPASQAGAAASAEADATPYVVPPLANEYKNDAYRFALSMPEGFKAGELPNEDGQAGNTIILQDVKGNGVQILITPYPSDTHELSAAQIQQDIPDMQITDVQPVEIGSDYKGVAFKSDNSAFGGASREVWFVFHGNLYQISTYARLDSLLQGIFATWKFF